MVRGPPGSLAGGWRACARLVRAPAQCFTLPTKHHLCPAPCSDLCTDDSTPVENVCPTAPPCTETVPGCATCNTDNTCATCDTTKFWQETPQEGACVCQDGYEPSSVPGAGACVPVTPTDCNSIPGCNQCDADDNSICAACDIANKFKPTPVDNEVSRRRRRGRP